VGDAPVDDIDSLVLAINTMPPGSKVKLKLLRRDELLERTVELAKYRVEGEVIATNRPPAWRGLHVDYTSTLPQTNFAADMLHAMAIGGVTVTEVEPGSPADKAGLKVGQVIKSIEARKIRSPREFAQAIAKLSGPVRLDTDQGLVTIR
jgi:serine protease Do